MVKMVNFMLYISYHYNNKNNYAKWRKQDTKGYTYDSIYMRIPEEANP